jgi:DNA-directed RNA polymerase specialized sigma24 family protein
MKVKGYKDEDIKVMLKIPMGTIASKYSRMRTRIIEEFIKMQ